MYIVHVYRCGINALVLCIVCASRTRVMQIIISNCNFMCRILASGCALSSVCVCIRLTSANVFQVQLIANSYVGIVLQMCALDQLYGSNVRCGVWYARIGVCICEVLCAECCCIQVFGFSKFLYIGYARTRCVLQLCKPAFLIRMAIQIFQKDFQKHIYDIPNH